MILGFTGSSDEVTDWQERIMVAFVRAFRPEKVHHGSCQGADALMDRICAAAGAARVVHPGHDKHGASPKRALVVPGAVEVRESKPYLDRNKDIVNETDLLLAVPNGPEQQRSGTWSTVRYARSVHRNVVIIWPNGSLDIIVPGLELPGVPDER